MAVKLKEALPEKGAPRTVPILAALYGKVRHGIPRCPGSGCGIELTHTSAYPKNSGRTVVSAHFGLRKGQKHRPGCKYDIDATLRKIVAKSHEVRELGTAALVEHVGSREEQAVEFRLHVLLAGMEPGRILNRQDPDPEVAYAYRESDRRLTAYMNCVESIVMVADVIGDDAELEEKVQVVFNGEKIPWRDFFFGFKEHRRLWKAWERIQGRPVTVEFERRKRETASSPHQASGHYHISGEFELEPDNPPYNVQVQLQVGDKALADAIWDAKQVVVCGIPRFKPADFTRSRKGSYAPFAHIILPIRDKSQVFAVGGGLLEVPRHPDKERYEGGVPEEGAASVPSPNRGVPFTDTPPPEDRPPPDVPSVEDTVSSGDPLAHGYPESEDSGNAEGGADEVVDREGAGLEEQVSPASHVDPTLDALPPDPEPGDSEAPRPGEASGDTDNERPAHMAPVDSGTATYTPEPRGAAPSLSRSPPEFRSSDSPPVDDAAPDGNPPEPPPPAAEDDRPAQGGTDEAVAGTPAAQEEQVPSASLVYPELNGMPPGSGSVELEASSGGEASEDGRSPDGRRTVIEDAASLPYGGPTPVQTRRGAVETPQSTAQEDRGLVTATSNGPAPGQAEAPTSPRQEAVTASPQTRIARGIRLSRVRKPVVRAVMAVKQGAVEVMERGRSAGRRLLALFGGRG
ncbi:hypothetical protein [Belnapia sp. F-4-1]|uniref:hypothetical protein n=1 Tax=Belnapia sp. F-4-1 TaxID=1545443 RepID=UPI001186FB7C|nr:hypothetical protein [Belnapia sp. F-4-1]